MTAILAFDLETMPDVEAGRRLFGFHGTDEDVARAMRNRQLTLTNDRTDFLPPHFHRIVALGIAGVTLGPEPKVKAEGWAGESEPSLIFRFMSAIGRRPQLVSWNGNGFDLPVIRYRALVHNLNTADLDGPSHQKNWESYLYRYGEMHVDLMDVLSGHGASPRSNLDDVARLVGQRGKGGMSGEDVLPLALAGEWAKIAGYVKGDAVEVLLLFLRWEVGRGRLQPHVYHAAENSLNAPAEELVLS